MLRVFVRPASQQPPAPLALVPRIEYALELLDERCELLGLVIERQGLMPEVQVMGEQARLEQEGVEIMPVFHQGETWEVLEGYVATHEYVGVGFARKSCTCEGEHEKGAGCPAGKLKYGKRENAAFLEEFFARVGGRKTQNTRRGSGRIDRGGCLALQATSQQGSCGELRF